MEEMRQKKFEMQAPHVINTHAVGYDVFGTFIHDVSAAVDHSHSDIEPDDRASISSSKLRLLVGSSIVNDIRRGVFEETGYTCSAGIAHNKILAKLVCGMNKPNKQTILPLNSIDGLFSKLEISKIKSMGAKTGVEVCRTLNARVMTDLLKYSEDELTGHFGPRIGNFLYLIARGIDLEKVTFKINSKSIAVSKNFRGASEIINSNTLKYWLTQLSKEVKERLESDALETNRVCRQLIVQFSQFIEGKEQSCSRTVQLNGNILNNYSFEEIASEAFSVIQKACTKFLKFEDKSLLNHAIRHLGISAGKFETNNGGDRNSMQNFLNNHQKRCKEEVEEQDKVVEEEIDDIFAFDEVQEAPKIRVKSKFQLMGTFKKFEHTSQDEGPTGELKKCEEEHPVVPEPENDIKACVKFNTETSIQGILTLKHWISEIFKELDAKLTAECLQKHHAPQEIELNWQQVINNQKMNFSVSLPIYIFANDVIHPELILDTMKDSSSNFIVDDKINPITLVEFVAKDFKENEEWKLKWIEDDAAECSMKENSNAFLDETITNDNLEMDATEKSIPLENLSPARAETSFKEEEMEEEEDEIASLEQDFVNTENELPMPSTSKCENVYTDTYAEFHGGDLLDELNPLEKCLECGKMIRKWDLVTHIDGHLAMRIAQSQRDEFRAEQKLKQLGGKAKDIPKPKKVFFVKNSIEKFTKKREDNSEIMDSQIICDECNEVVEESDFQVHKDHHFAQKLRNEQMDHALKSNENNIKRKRSFPPTATSTGSNAKKTKSLKDFFSN